MTSLVSSSSEEADIRDGTDVLEDEGTGTVIPSSVKESDEEKSDGSYTKSFERWKQDYQCPSGTSQGDCACDVGY